MPKRVDRNPQFQCLFFFTYLFTFGCAGSSLLRGLFSSCGGRPLFAVASLVAAPGV